MSTPTVLVHRDPDELAGRGRRPADHPAGRRRSRPAARHRWCSPAGRSRARTLAAVAASPARDAVDWRRLDLWWGDERFLPSGDPERNETLAREALLDHVPLDPARVHPMAGQRRAGR